MVEKYCREDCKIIKSVIKFLKNSNKHRVRLIFLEILNATILIVLLIFILSHDLPFSDSLLQIKLNFDNSYNNLKSELNARILNLKIGKFNSDELLTAYYKSIKACENYPMEGTGSFYICQGEYFKKYQPKLSDIEYNIYKYCTNIGAYYMINSCMEERIKLRDEKYNTKK